AYGGATIPVKGVLNAQVALREQPQQLTLLVTDLEQGSNFMGLDWLDAFGRRLSGSDSVCFVEEQGVNTVIKHIVGKYEAVFRLNLHLTRKDTFLVPKNMQDHLAVDVGLWRGCGHLSMIYQRFLHFRLLYKIHFSSPVTIEKFFFWCLSNRVWQASTGFFFIYGFEPAASSHMIHIKHLREFLGRHSRVLVKRGLQISLQFP
ncbi:hypothetical protein M513_12390, partial [Trichuris suis]